MEIKNLEVLYDKNKIFDNFSINIDAGVTAIMGASGVGKTTLLKAIAGLVDYTGDIEYIKFGYVLIN